MIIGIKNCGLSAILLNYLTCVEGSYSSTQGITVVRQDIADFIAKRDGYPACYEDIFLINGGAEGIEVRHLL